MNLKRRWGREMGTKIVDTNSVVFKNKRWSCAVIENIIEVHPFHAHCRVIKNRSNLFIYDPLRTHQSYCTKTFRGVMHKL